MADWANFFVAEVGAAAALVGLVAVAISINLQRILSFPLLPARAAETLFQLTAVFVLSSLALVPGQPGALFGAEVLVAVGLTAFVSVRAQAGAWRYFDGVSLGKRIVRVAMSVFSLAPLLIGGALISADHGAGLYWLAGGILVSLICSIWNAWILLVEIMR